MLGLIYKDILILKKDIMLIFGAIFLCSLPFLYPWADSDAMVDFQIASAIVTPKTMSYTIVPLLMYLTMFVIMSVLQSGIFEHDEREEWMNYMVSTPLALKGYVRSKYIISLGMSLILVAFGVFCDMMCRVATGISGSAWKIYVTFFLIQTILRATEFPLIIRFGHKHGKIYKVVILVGVIYLAGVYALFGKLPNLKYSNIVGELINLLADSGKMSDYFTRFIVILACVAIPIYLISYKVSTVLARRTVK